MNRRHRMRAFSRNLDYQVALACGCLIKARNKPMSGRQTYGCTTGLAHGYTLPWKAYTDPDGNTMQNKVPR